MAKVYEYYMKHIGTDNDDMQPTMNLEEDFDGLKVLAVSGLMSQGKAKNIYTEDYADAEAQRVFMPQSVTYEPTKVGLRAGFFGDNCRSVYESFLNYISGNKIEYWDTVRNRKVTIILTEAIEVETDNVKNDQYIVVDFSFTNIYGKSFPV